jgi:ZIP family zinc transporter
VGVDLFVDGCLIGVGYAAGPETGALVTIALGIEALFLGLSTGAATTGARWPRRQSILASGALALLLPLGAAAGAGVLGGLEGAGLEAAISFGAAALLYLVTEELLVEAHDVPETPASAAMFFAGFLILLLVAMLA